MNTTEITIADVHHADRVVHGAFGASYSLKDLAAELQVSEQAIYDLRAQGRSPGGSGSGAACASADPRSRHG